jgi:dTDP-4-amino-4,6-dideoxygalactose transaminase
MIPFKIPVIHDEEIQAVVEAMQSKQLSSGQVVSQFEEEFADYVGANHAIAVNCCTSALYLSFQTTNISHQKVFIPSMLPPLVVNTIIHAGGVPHFIDDCNWVGHCYHIKPFPIYDSAHEVKKQMFSNLPNDAIVCYSFYPTKPIGSCDGGMICTNDDNKAAWFRKARIFGRSSGNYENSWESSIEFPGWKMYMSDIQASIALPQLRRLNKTDMKRKHILDLYNQLLETNNTSMYLYRINVKERDGFIKYMFDNGIECGIHFRPLHNMKIYSQYDKDSLIETEKNGISTVSLPFYDSLYDESIKHISDLVRKWLRQFP